MLAKSTPYPLVEDDGDHTTADLLYYQPPTDPNEKPYDRLYDGLDSKGELLPKRNFISKVFNKPIYDLRNLINSGNELQTNIDITGFQVLSEKTAKTEMNYNDWDNEEIIKVKYYKEVELLLKKVTGATKVVIFDHTIRRVERKGEETEDAPSSRKPVARVHIDQTPASGRARVVRHAGEEAEALLQGRAQLVNVWRPLRGPVQDAPLAVCDARTLTAERDLVPSRLLYQPPANEGETFQVAHSPEHRWYYLSNMTPNEVLLLKCWENDLEAAKTPHSGIVDDKFKGVYMEEPRQSIEVRTLIFHDKE